MTNAALPPVQVYRTTTAALLFGLVAIGLATLLILPTDYPPVWVPVVLGVLAVLTHLAVQAVGYRVPAVSPGATPDAARAGVLPAFGSAFYLRFAMCEAVGIIGLLLAFVTRAWWAYGVGGAFALLLIWWHCWPSDRLVGVLQSRYDRDGGRSELADVLAGREPGSPPGPMLPT